MELVIVQLTDIHIKDDEDFDVFSNRIDSLVGAICNHITEPDGTAVLFCVTGDLASSGQENQYVAVEIIIRRNSFYNTKKIFKSEYSLCVCSRKS